jgi:hypothetical protein
MKRETIEVITGKMISARDEVRPNLCQRFPAQMWQMNGGRGGIRTPGRIAPTSDFESDAFNHSATLPAVRRTLNHQNPAPQILIL